MPGEASPDSGFLSFRGSFALILAVTYLPFSWDKILLLSKTGTSLE